MQISHLRDNGHWINCTECGQTFEVKRKVMRDQMALVEYKEELAEKHVCRKRSAAVERTPTRVWRAPVGAQLEPYFVREVRRYLPVM